MNTRKIIALALSISMVLGSVGAPLVGVLAPAKKVAASDEKSSEAAPTADPSKDKTVTLWNNETETTITLPGLNPKGDDWTPVGWTTSTDPFATTSASGASVSVTDNTTFYGVYKRSLLST